MPSGRDVEAEVREVAALGEAPPTPASRARLVTALASDSAYVVTKAAAVAAAWGDAALADALVEAFGRLLGGGAKADPGCLAKLAVVDALGRLGADGDGERLCTLVFLPGARARQWEAVWGGRADTAGRLRGACALGLSRWGHGAALEVLADHLADEDAAVRASAARALAERGRADAVPLLRLRAQIEDDDARVLGECFRALLALDPAGALPLVAARLEDADDERFAEAAFALGECRFSGALEVLAAAWDATFDPGRRRLLLTAVAALRSEEGIAFLLARLEECGADLATAALEALAVHAADEGVRRRTAEAVAAHADPEVDAAFRRLFD